MRTPISPCAWKPHKQQARECPSLREQMASTPKESGQGLPPELGKTRSLAFAAAGPRVRSAAPDRAAQLPDGSRRPFAVAELKTSLRVCLWSCRTQDRPKDHGCATREGLVFAVFDNADDFGEWPTTAATESVADGFSVCNTRFANATFTMRPAVFRVIGASRIRGLRATSFPACRKNLANLVVNDGNAVRRWGSALSAGKTPV